MTLPAFFNIATTPILLYNNNAYMISGERFMKGTINQVNRTIASIKLEASLPDNDLVKATPSELIGFISVLTEELYSLKGNFNAEQRLQRNVTNLIRP